MSFFAMRDGLSRSRVLLFSAGAVLGGVLGAAALAELGLRIYHVWRDVAARRALPPVAERCIVPSDDPELIFELNPGWRGEGFTVNRFGMADDDVALQKPEGVFRIAFVGDSLTCNFRLCPRPEIYVEVLERMLNERYGGHPRVECLNFGVNGYGILQELHLTRTRVPRFDPDLVVLQLCLNDPYPSDTPYARTAPLHPLRLRNFLFRVTWNERFVGYMFVERFWDEAGPARMERGLEGFGEIARRGPPILAVLFPYFRREAYEDWGYGRYHDFVAETAARAGLPLLDLYEPFARAGFLDRARPEDPLHPGPRGHRLAAEVLLRELDARGWLPPSPASRAVRGRPASTGGNPEKTSRTGLP